MKGHMKHEPGDLVMLMSDRRWWWSGRLGMYVCHGVENNNDCWNRDYHTIVVSGRRVWLHGDMFERVM